MPQFSRSCASLVSCQQGPIAPRSSSILLPLSWRETKGSLGDDHGCWTELCQGMGVGVGGWPQNDLITLVVPHLLKEVTQTFWDRRKSIAIREFPGGLEVKDLMLSLLWLGATVVWVRPLVWKLQHAEGAASPPKKKGIMQSMELGPSTSFYSSL